MAVSTSTLHRLVWRNHLETLATEAKGPELEAKDPHGRTPLMLAVCLGHLEAAKILIKAGADVNTETEGWTVVQEATATGNPRLVQLVLEERDKVRYGARMGGIPDLLVKLKDVPDFYVDMTWEFTSWLPLVSRMCPSDTYRVYKRGSSVRVDTTLLGFDHNSWVRGNRTYIFKGEKESASFIEVDHDARQVFQEEMRAQDTDGLSFSSPEQVEHRISTPLVQTYLDTDNISFQRVKSGFFGWGSDKSELVSGMECKVFAANNVEVVTKTRMEHMSAADKENARANKNPLLTFFGPSETADAAETSGAASLTAANATLPTEEEYFAEESMVVIGTPKEEYKKGQKFKAQLWLCEDYPLSLQEQIMPIVDLLAISNTHFQKLKDFIHMQLPSGFPVKIEIPLFHVINARITFSNIQALDESVRGVTSIREDCGRSSAAIDDSVFEIPRAYTTLGNGAHSARQQQYAGDEEDLLIQYAIRQSLNNTTSNEQVDIWEALGTETQPEERNGRNGAGPKSPGENGADHAARPLPFNQRFHIENEERLLQEAIEASMSEFKGSATALEKEETSVESKSSAVEVVEGATEDELSLALRLSETEETTRQTEMRKREEQLRLEEEEMLARVLQLSLQEK